MGPLTKNKGKAKAPSFYKQTPTPTPAKPSTTPLLLGAVVVAGVGYVLIMRGKHISGPAITVVPSYDADVSRIQNLTNSALAIASVRSHGATSDN